MPGEPRSLRIAVVAPGQLGEVGTGVAEALDANGHRVFPVNSGSDWPVTVDLVVSFGPMAAMDDMLRHLKLIPEVVPVIFWYTEPLPSPSWPNRTIAASAGLHRVWRSSWRLLRRAGIDRAEALAQVGGRLRACSEMRELNRRGNLQLLAVFTRRHEQLFRAWDLPAVTIPMGYCPSFGHLMDLERDIDVAFVGSTRDKRRGPLVADLTRQLTAAGLRVVIKDGSPQHGYAFGAERTELLNRTKILLSIMRQPWDDPVFRTLLAAPNGAMVLSEPVRDSGPFVPGQHFITTSLEQMVVTAKHYVQAEEERRSITQAAHQFVTRELTMVAMAERLLQAWQKRAIVDPQIESQDRRKNGQ